LLVILASLEVFAADYRLEVLPAGKSFIDTNPGQNVTLATRVSNRSGNDLELKIRTVLPENWQLVVPPSSFTLGNAQTENRIVSFLVPANTAPGRYRVKIEVYSNRNPSISGSFSVDINVNALYDYTIELLDKQKEAVAGEDVRVRFVVTNKSNVQDHITLRAFNSDNYKIEFEPREIILNSGESRDVTAIIHTAPTIKDQIINLTSIDLFRKSSAESAAKQTLYLDIFPRNSRPVDPFFRYPVEWSGTWFWEKDIDGKNFSGYQTQLSGAGYLDQLKHNYLAFNARYSDAYSKGLNNSEYDEYWLEYRYKNLFFGLGDRVYSLSQMTQDAEYGRGAEFIWNMTPEWSFGMYYQKNRPDFSDLSESTGGFLRYAPNQGTSLQANAIRIRNDIYNASLYSVKGKAALLDSDIEAEYAISPGDGKSEQAMYADIYHDGPWWSLSLGGMYASHDFPGTYRDVTSLNATLNLNPVNQLRFNTTYRYQEQNADLDTLRYNAPRTLYVSPGITWSFNLASSLSFEYIYDKYRDLLSPDFDYLARYGRLTFSSGFGESFTYSLFAESGTSTDLQDDSKSPLQSYGADLNYSPGTSLNLSGYVTYSNNDLFTDNKQETIVGGIGTDWYVTPEFLLSLKASYDYSPDDYYDRIIDTRLFVQYKLPNEHRIKLEGRQRFYGRNSANDKDETSVMAEYIIPVGIPLARRFDVVILKGEVYDSQALKPLPGLVVRLGNETSVTDLEGKFTFYSLRPEMTSYLQFDKSSIGIDRVPDIATPIEITPVKGAREQNIKIGITDAARVTGKVVLKTVREKKQPRQAKNILTGTGEFPARRNGTDGKDSVRISLANLMVEMDLDSQIERRLTDEKGFFEFEGLRPGKWTLLFYDRNLPAYHRFEEPSISLQLDPGEEKTITANIIPVTRVIQFQNRRFSTTLKGK
jgi:hypothetical protein